MDSESGGLKALAIVTVFVLGLALFQVFGQADQKSQELAALRDENGQLKAQVQTYKVAIDERNGIIHSLQQAASQTSKDFETLRSDNDNLRAQNTVLLEKNQDLTDQLGVAVSDRNKLFNYGIQLIIEKQELQDQLNEQLAMQKPSAPKGVEQPAPTFPTESALVIFGLATGGPLASVSVFISQQKRIRYLLSQPKSQVNHRQAHRHAPRH